MEEIFAGPEIGLSKSRDRRRQIDQPMKRCEAKDAKHTLNRNSSQVGFPPASVVVDQQRIRA
ncbi:MAG TPA: hypothetical protein VK789_30615 [Bryobacteraceae bacterium]|nr:hypothetical protein [Bryobacteraceae bacterium]